MTNKQDVISRAIEIANGILAGKVQPNEGCTRIANLCEANGLVEELFSFYALSHEQIGHEQFGFDAENTAPLIVEECRKLVKKCS